MASRGRGNGSCCNLRQEPYAVHLYSTLLHSRHQVLKVVVLPQKPVVIAVYITCTSHEKGRVSTVINVTDELFIPSPGKGPQPIHHLLHPSQDK